MNRKLFRAAFLVAFAAFSAFFAQKGLAQNLYAVHFPDDKTIVACDGSAPLDWPVVTMNQCSVAVGISHSDLVYELAPDACKKIVRTWRLLSWCNFDPNWPPTVVPNPTGDAGPTANGTVANRGYLEYEQIIKILDAGDPVISSSCADLTFCDYSANDPSKFSAGGHDRCEGPVGPFSVKAWDECSKSNLLFKYLLFIDTDENGTLDQTIVSDAAGAFPILISKNHDTATATIALPTGYELPYGRHKIKWIVRDGCGNETACGQFFDVKDCKKPSPICQHLSSTLMQPSGMLALDVDDFLLYATDNCTAAGDLMFGIRLAGAGGAGFPTAQTINLTCANVGLNAVEIWAKDASGNADFCLTSLVLTAHPNCPPAPFPIFGSVTLPDGSGLESAVISLAPLAMASATNADGQFLLQNVPPATAFSLSTAFDEPISKRLTAADAQRLKDHLTGILPFSSPFQLLAADLDGSKTIDWADYQLLRQAVSGLLAELPDGKKAWRFFDAKAVIADPTDPFATAFSPSISGNGPMAGACAFRAYKMGDLVDQIDSVAAVNPTQVIDNQAVASLSVAPNPFSERLVLGFEIEKTQRLRVVVTDVFGKIWLAQTRDFLAGKNNWLFENEAAAWPSGSLFFIKIEDEKGRSTVRRAMKI